MVYGASFYSSWRLILPNLLGVQQRHVRQLVGQSTGWVETHPIHRGWDGMGLSTNSPTHQLRIVIFLQGPAG